MEEKDHVTRRRVLAAGAASTAALGVGTLGADRAEGGQERAQPPKAAPARHKGLVRITMPAAVGNDLKKLKDSITAVMERLGCPKCTSGYDILFQLERDLVINQRLEVAPTARVFSVDPDGEPARAVTAHLAKEVRFDIKQLHAAVERIVGKLGHPGCFSGFDIAFLEEIRVLTVDRNLNVQAVGG